MRQIYQFDALSEAVVTVFTEPTRLAFRNPRRAGPSVFEIRKAFGSKGKLRFSGTPKNLYVDFDPGEEDAPLIALDTIVRSDAAGLERMLLSALPHVDEIVLGVDARSDAETRLVAEAYADEVFTFTADDLHMAPAAWEANKIDFAAARNLGRARVKAPWTLVIDSDEYLSSAKDLRWLVNWASQEVGSFSVPVELGGFLHRDAQRLTRTRYRWTSSTHNQLIFTERVENAEALIVGDLSLRSTEEGVRRAAQRDLGIEDLIGEAAKGNLAALMHLAKHRAGCGDIEEAVRLGEDYRLRIEPHSALSEERAWVALTLAYRFYQEDNLPEADRWAVRALLDGPRCAAFCLLGDIAEDEGDLPRARGWYEAACALTEKSRVDWPGLTEMRWGRLSGIVNAMSGLTTVEIAP